jgi:hypothetical protein
MASARVEMIALSARIVIAIVLMSKILRIGNLLPMVSSRRRAPLADLTAEVRPMNTTERELKNGS